MINTMHKEVWSKEEYMEVVNDLYSLLHKEKMMKSSDIFLLLVLTTKMNTKNIKS